MASDRQLVVVEQRGAAVPARQEDDAGGQGLRERGAALSPSPATAVQSAPRRVDEEPAAVAEDVDELADTRLADDQVATRTEAHESRVGDAFGEELDLETLCQSEAALDYFMAWGIDPSAEK